MTIPTTMLIPVICPNCGNFNVVSVKSKDWFAYVNGALVQDAFPYLFADEREMLISGICPGCWERLFGDEDEEEENWEEGFDEMGFNPYMGCYDFDC